MKRGGETVLLFLLKIAGLRVVDAEAMGRWRSPCPDHAGDGEDVPSTPVELNHRPEDSEKDRRKIDIWKEKENKREKDIKRKSRLRYLIDRRASETDKVLCVKSPVVDRRFGVRVAELKQR